jgi:uncharacterized protein (DUF2141 family)
MGITSFYVPKTVVELACSMNISLRILNYGVYDETFTVKCYANTAILVMQTITLAKRNSTTLTFTWNTTGFAKGNYILNVYAGPVQDETDTADNNFTGELVKVAMIGDVNADGKVDGKDLGWVVWCFGYYPGAPPLTWDPNCDINNDGKVDGKVDGKDLGIVAGHFGEPHP